MEPLTAAALATLLVTKMIEKLGESLGEKIPELGSHVWEQVAKLKDVMKAKSPETMAVLTAAESAPGLVDAQPDVFGLPVLTQKVETLATAEPDVAELIEALDADVRPQLPTAFQEKLVQQVLLKGIKGKSIKATDLNQTAAASATKVSQEMLVDVDVEGGIDVSSASQTA
ncbi:hypothetical protein [Leptothoe spongobia]|uniref:Uncharacterized protein n=1 Tax=Leptothoe spongobia TAU-MAC 1115 TaxID=1967444 RepID=A0A947DGF4_9CYAN|nr:hypothetical protein [Leptothoe spongobia]MBT9316290.1 hypothetical protein [Leptothoe spongobia TAU-MAC 1115]